jgi:hypothetical protein
MRGLLFEHRKRKMIKFIAILENEGIDPQQVKLVRHQHGGYGLTPYQLW